MTVAMKDDLVGPRQRGLAMGLNEFAGYGGLGVTASLTGYIAARTGHRPEAVYVGIVYAVVGLGLSIVAVRDTTAFMRHAAPAKPTPGGPSRALDQDSRALDQESARRTMFGVCQAGLVNNLNDGISWGVLPLLFAAHGLLVNDIGIIRAVRSADLEHRTACDRCTRRPRWASTALIWGMIVQALALGVIAGLPSTYLSGIGGAILLGL